MPPVVIREGAVSVAAIQAAITARVRLRAETGLPVPDAEIEALKQKRLENLTQWNFPDEVWAAMWPPRLRQWNLDEPFPIRSHRPLAGRLLVASKRLLRAVVSAVARPLLTQQVEINRALALVTLSLADELARERLHLRALEQRLARVGAVSREASGEEEPLVVFASEPGAPSAPETIEPDPRGRSRRA